MDTPLWNSIDFVQEFDSVYEPSQDSFLLLDALEQDLDFLKQKNPTICLEIGCGSGIITTALAKYLTQTLFIATDINKKACEALKRCCSENHVNDVCVEPIITDLSTAIDTRLKSQIDLMLFNPPYVPTPDEEIQEIAINRAWAGGINGRKVIDQFLNQCLSLLSIQGCLYLLLLRENLPQEIVQILVNKGFDCKIILERKCFNEHLLIVRAIKQQRACVD